MEMFRAGLYTNATVTRMNISCENWATDTIHMQENLGLLFLASSTEMWYGETVMSKGVSDTTCQHNAKLPWVI